MLLLRNKDQLQKNPLLSSASQKCAHEWTAITTAWHQNRESSAALVQYECHSGK